MSDDIAEAKRRFSLPKLMTETAYGDRVKKRAHCPFHDDQAPSFSVFEKDGQFFWKCFAGCGEGDQIDFIAKAKGIDRKEATKEFLRMAGITGESRYANNNKYTTTNGAMTNGAKQKEAKPALPVGVPRIAKLEAPDKPVTFEQWRCVIAANFPTLARPAEVCLSVIAQLLLNDVSNPFALALVDVPSSGKTITLNFFGGTEELIYTSDNFTPAAFVSHASNVKREDLDKVDLLPRIRHRTLIVRELGSVFGAKDDDLMKSLGILTRVLDGEGLETDSGVHGKRGYKGDYLFMLLAGTPPIAPRVFKVMGNFGSRLFFLALHTPTETDDELIAQNLGEDRKSRENICKAATEALLRTLWGHNPSGVTWNKAGDPRDCLKVIAKCARLLAHLRGAINVWSIGDDGEKLSHSVPVIEKPNRINCLLYNLARAHAVIRGRRQLTPEDLWPVLDVTFDSAPTTRAKVFRALIERGALTTTDVVKLLRCSPPTARKEMEALAVLGVAERTDSYAKDEAGRPEIEITLDSRFEWFASPECKALMKDEHTPSITTEMRSEGDTNTGWKSFQNSLSPTTSDNVNDIAANLAEDGIKKEIAPSVTMPNQADSDIGKMIYPGDWLWFRDAADFAEFWGAKHPLPETCIGLNDSDCRRKLDAFLDGLSCGCKLADEPDGFYYHRTRHIARCGDCQEAEWIAQGFEVVNGFPWGDWSLTTAERIAEQKKSALEELARWEKRQQEQLVADAKALFNAAPATH
jgi:hypothetical protein